jgi:hypothetical protein
MVDSTTIGKEGRHVNNCAPAIPGRESREISRGGAVDRHQETVRIAHQGRIAAARVPANDLGRH